MKNYWNTNEAYSALSKAMDAIDAAEADKVRFDVGPDQILRVTFHYEPTEGDEND